MSAPRRRKSSDRPGARRRPVEQRDFWGKDTKGEEAIERIRPSHDPTVMLHSLSSPPLPGRETIAVHYFAAVAEKAAALAVALAASSDLLDLDELDD